MASAKPAQPRLLRTALKRYQRPPSAEIVLDPGQPRGIRWSDVRRAWLMRWHSLRRDGSLRSVARFGEERVND